MSETDSNHELQTYLDSFNKEIEEEGAVPTEESCESDEELYYFEDKEDECTKAATESKSKNNVSKKLATSTSSTASNANFKIADGSMKQPEDDKEVYNFDEHDEENADAKDDVMVVVSKVVKLKENVEVKLVNRSKKSKAYTCMHCNYTASKPYLLGRHLKTHSNDRPYKCNICERGFKTNAALLNHVNTHLGKKPHQCTMCEKCFTTSGELVRHNRYRHTFEKPHKCSECDFSSVELSKLRRHMRCHTGERPFQCPHCTYASPDSFKLKRHMRTHTGEKPYECDICNARFTQSNSLKAHKLIHSVGDRPVFQCTLCPTTCGRKTDLRLHVLKLHHSDKPIKCKRCSKELPDRYSYKLHIKSHDGEKCYQCNYCPYASISQRHLDSHLLIHTDKKPFVCTQCDMCFRQRQLLKRHINLYHDTGYVAPQPREKIHTCGDCNRTFTHKGNLMRHMELMHDPETRPKTMEQKIQLKAGRLRRIDDTSEEAEYIVDEYNDHIYESSAEEDYELIETIDDELDQKPTQFAIINDTNASVSNVPQIKSVRIKKESDGKEFMAVEDDDNQQYMIEVIQYDEEEDDDSRTAAYTNIPMQQQVDADKTNLDNNFGFEEEVGEEYYDDTEDKQTIHLLDIIDDD